MQKLDNLQLNWLYPLKRKILIGILGILTLSIIATMLVIALFLRSNLINDSKIKTQELSNAIKSSLSSLMLKRDPDMILDTVKNIGNSNNSIVKAFIINKTGRIAYSSDQREIGKVLDRYTEPSCRGCHKKLDIAPPETTLIMNIDGVRVHRNVRVIYNESACYGCHSKSDRINGKLIIDRSLKKTYSFIASIEIIIFASGLVCLVLLIPFLSNLLSRGLDQYILKIVNQNSELSLLYVMIERLSKTIDFEELKHIVVDIVNETLDSEQINLIFPRGKREFSSTTWTKGVGKATRKRVDKDDPLLPIINEWLDGKLTEGKVSDAGKDVIMPIIKSNTRLALIIARKEANSFDPLRLGLVKTMCSHIAVAFENAMLYDMAITDELTRLYAPRHFKYIIDKKFLDFEKYGEKITLLMLDIDNFKKINDTYGHMAGDSVLREVARLIQYSVRDGDLAFRYGGEEFAVILPSTDAAGGTYVAERIRGSIETALFEAGEHNLKVTISIGVSTCPDNAQTIRDLIMAADKALYTAKQTGKNRVVVGESKPSF